MFSLKVATGEKSRRKKNKKLIYFCKNQQQEEDGLFYNNGGNEFRELAALARVITERDVLFGRMKEKHCGTLLLNKVRY